MLDFMLRSNPCLRFRSVAVSMLFVCAVVTGHAQQEKKEEVSTYAGLKLGLQLVAMDSITSGPAGLTDPVVAFPADYGLMYGIEAGARLPFSDALAINTGIGFTLNSVGFLTTQQSTVNPRGVPIPVTVEETLDLSWYELNMLARLEWTLGGWFDVQLGLGATFPGSMTVVARERILEPPEATYDERNRERLRFSGGLVSQAALRTELRIAAILRMTEKLDVVPFIEAAYTPTSLASQVNINTASISFGAQVRLATSFFVETDVPPIILTAPRIPEHLLVNTERRFDSPLPEISMIRAPYLATAVQVQLTGLDAPPTNNADIVVRVLNCLRLRLADTDIDPESTIWDATRFELIHKDSILDATPPTAIIRVRSTAEAGVASGSVRAMSGGALAFENTWSASTDTVFSWPLRELPVTALAGDTTAIQIHSTVTDHFGGESVSIPQQIVVIRSRPTKRSALVPDLVTADFTTQTFLRGTDDLSKAGRGLVAALSDHAREARVIRFKGPIERCKRVLNELAPTGNVRVEMPKEQATSEDDAVVVMIER